MFQKKIRGMGNIRDNVRHEWISSYIFEKCISGGFPKTETDIDSYFPNRANILGYHPRFAIGGEPLDIESVITWLINSHHKLMGGGKDLIPSDSNHVIRDENVARVTDADLMPWYTPEQKRDLFGVFCKIEKLYNRIRKFNDQVEEEYLRFPMILARAGLILADHTVSSGTYNHKTKPAIDSEESYANTKGTDLDQPLVWHLYNVSSEASNMVHNLMNHNTTPISESTIKNIVAESPEKYSWQDDGNDEIINTVTDSKIPAFIINAAGTGCGKTRANAKLAATLCRSRNKPVQMMAVLNLRSLTEQTGREYTEYWYNKPYELSTIIGGSHSSTIKEILDKEEYDGDESEVNYDVDGESLEVPNFLKVVSRGKKHVSKLIGVPAIISTIDFIINAGNVGKQANHAIAMLKLKDNVLILDEIDSYDPNQLIDVAKTIEIAGMMNCDIILSSATTPSPIVKMLYKVFYNGVKNRLMDSTINIPVVFINERSHEGYNINDCHDVVTKYESFCTKNIPATKTKFYEIIKVGDNNIFDRDSDTRETVWFETIRDSVPAFHSNNNTLIDGVRVSFGFVRCSNITPLISFCKFMSATHDNSDYTLRLCAYHSSITMLHRGNMERKLDHILKRKSNTTTLPSDEDITSAVSAAKRDGNSDVIFIVVASPVEEIGRDHDFDWGIFEFSSMHSFIQSAGRINRHRGIDVSIPNIGVLQYTYKTMVRGENVKCFVNPGMEITEPFETHDVFRLLNRPSGYITPDLRFDNNNLIVRLENDVLKKLINRVDIITNNDSKWFGEEFHKKYKLRDNRFQTFTYTEYDEKFYDFRKRKWEEYELGRINDNISDLNWLTNNHPGDIFNNETLETRRKVMSVSLSTFGNDYKCVLHDPWGYRMEKGI